MSFLTDIITAKREEVRAARGRTPEAVLLAGLPKERRDFAAGHGVDISFLAPDAH